MKYVMLSLSYTTSPLLSDFLHDIDALRRHILLTPLSPSVERALAWQAILARIHGTLALTVSPVSQRLVTATLTHPKKRATPDEERIAACHQTLSFIRHQWSASPESLTPEAIAEVALYLFPTRKERVQRNIDTADHDIRQVLRYVEAKTDHPVIVAAIIHVAFLVHSPIPDDEGLLSRALCALTLAKHGYDLRAMAAPEAVFGEDPQAYHRASQSALSQPTITSWLEYIAGRIRRSYQSLYANIEKINREPLLKRSEGLPVSDRQKKIVELLSDPTATITNRMVQRHFRVSQVTASRDLTRLTALGLLYSHGKGRAVSYTPV